MSLTAPRLLAKNLKKWIFHNIVFATMAQPREIDASPRGADRR